MRHRAFLDLVRHAIFAYPKSPYRKLFQAAGCELGDVEALVGEEGLEGNFGEVSSRGYLCYVQ